MDPLNGLNDPLVGWVTLYYGLIDNGLNDPLDGLDDPQYFSWMT